MLQQQPHRQQQSIALKGSIELISEFLSTFPLPPFQHAQIFPPAVLPIDYSINSILYQRGIYPTDEFDRVKKYGIALYLTADPALKQYMDTIFSQLQKWMMDNVVEKIVLVIQSIATRETLERWTFDCTVVVAAERPTSDKENQPSSIHQTEHRLKPQKEIQSEIQAIIRQITASVTFLPVLEDKCTFNLLVYADRNAQVPSEWLDSDPKYIINPEQVRLRSLNTGVHQVDTMVAYRLPTV